MPATQPTERALGAAAASSFSCTGLCDRAQCGHDQWIIMRTFHCDHCRQLSSSRTSGASAAATPSRTCPTSASSARSTRRTTALVVAAAAGRRAHATACARTTPSTTSATGPSPADDPQPAVPVVPADPRHPGPAPPGPPGGLVPARGGQAPAGLHPARARPAARATRSTTRARAGVRVPGRPRRPDAPGADRPRRRGHHHQHRRGRRRRARAAAGSRCTSPTARCSATSATRVGHYYWDRLVARQRRASTAFRETVRRRARGLRRGARGATTSNGPPADWQQRFVSAYASAHPWEDWAETWAHYLHMVDTLETAAGVRPVAAAAPAPTSRRSRPIPDPRRRPGSRSTS